MTDRGRALRSDVERTTEDLASRPFEDALTGPERTDLLARLDPVAREVAGSRTIPYPNPIGLPALVELDA